jgi:hypothetical protein
MKRRKLLLTALGSIVLTSVVWARAGSSPDRPAEAAQPTAEEPLFSAAALRWRSGQPAHWRALLLHR